MELEGHRQFELKEGIVFLVELSDALLEPLAELDGQCQLLEILRCISDLMSDMVVTFPNNGVGIYLYNSNTTASKFPKGCGMDKVFSLNDLNSSNMKLLANLVRDDLDGFRPLTKRFVPAKPPLDTLHPVLKTVLREFQLRPHYNVRKLLWLTGSSTPYRNPDLKDSLRTLVSDFEDNHIYITPVFLATGDAQPFDAALYRNIFLNTNYLRADNAWLSTTGTAQIRTAIFRLREVRRVQFACDLVLSDDGGALGCSVKGYTLYNHEKVRAFRQVYTGGDALRLAHHDSSRVADGNDVDEEGVVVRGVPVKLSNADPADEKVLLLNDEVLAYMRGYSFDHEAKKKRDAQTETGVAEADTEATETAEVNETGSRGPGYSAPPYLKLLCFRELRTFQPFFNMKPAVFLTADLSDGLNSASKTGGYTNSLKTFGALYQSCVRLQRYGVVFGCVKKNSTPDLYAMYPTNSACSSMCQRQKDSPDGFLLINVPWLSEIRSLPDYMLGDSAYFAPTTEALPPELVSVYKKMFERLGTLPPYNPSEHENPVLSYFYKIIKHEALQIDIKDEDTSLEKNDWTARSAMEFRNNVDHDSRELMRFINVYLNKLGNNDVIKRSAEMNSDPLKRPRAEPLTEATVIALWKNDAWKNVTVAQLREFINRYDKIPSATRRAEMIANIVGFLESRQRK